MRLHKFVVRRRRSVFAGDIELAEVASDEA